jgi:hypothetical protein
MLKLRLMAGSWPRVSQEDRQNAFVLTNRSNGASCCGSSASAVSCASTAPFSGVRFRSSSAPSLERRPAMTTWIYRASRRAPRPLPFAVSLILQACTPRTRMQPQLATGALTGCMNRHRAGCAAFLSIDSVRILLRALIDPGPQNTDLFLGQRRILLTFVRGRHLHIHH